MKLLSNTQTRFIAFYRILSQISGKNHELTTSGASSMKCVVKTTTRPSRAARMMFHVALRLYGSIPVHCRKLFWSSISFDINQNQVAVLPQLWSVAKNWNDIGRICYSFGFFISISCICNLNITMKSNWSSIIILPIFSQFLPYSSVIRSPIPKCLKSAHPRRPQEVSQSALGKAKAFSFGHRTELLQKRSDPGRQSQSHSDSTVTPSPQLQDMSCTSLCLFGQTNLLHHLVATASHLQIWAPRCFWCFCVQSWQQAMRTSSKLK